MLVSLQSYTLLHFKRKQLLRWNVCQLSEDRNIRNIPSVTKGETHTNRLSFRLNKHKVSYFRLLPLYFKTARGRKTCLDGSRSLVREAEEGCVKVMRQHGKRLEVWCHCGTLLPNHLHSRKNPVPTKSLMRYELWSPSTLPGEALGPSRNTVAAFKQPKQCNTLLPAKSFIPPRPREGGDVYLLLRACFIRRRDVLQNCKSG